jgi:branched-chain amino acid transport system substrate-binding protein
MQRWLVAAVTAVVLTGVGSAPPPSSETFRIPVDSTGLNVLLRHQPPARRGEGRGRAPVLFVHGASFPSALAAGYRLDGVSWMDDLAARGFDVWALDFLGYGGSDRYPEMRDPPMAHPPLGRAGPAARQIAAAVEFITRRSGVSRVSIVAHSWGAIPAGLYASQHPERMARLVQFGPVTQRSEPADTSATPAHWVVTQEAQRARFFGYVPKGETPLMWHRHFAHWGPAYMASDSSSSSRVPASVDVPSGPLADADDAWSGHLAYDPGKITAPVLIVRGEWDDVTTDADARWLYDALTHAPLKRDVKISRGSHVMHLEVSRRQLYREVSAFLADDDVVPMEAADLTARWIELGAFGALSGPVKSFGINSWAALRAATDSINQAGGVRLGDGAVGYLLVTYFDDHCNPVDGIRIVREIAASSALVAIGPSCSSVAEPLYGTLPRLVADTGPKIPVFTDGATKAGLARSSEWAFRNAPNERDMYRALWAYVKRTYPTLRTIYGGEEADFAHSHSTWENIIRQEATAAGYTVSGTTTWSVADTLFDAAAEAMDSAHADILVISGHSPTTCGVLQALARRRVHPALVVGLTSASSPETLRRCRVAAEGLLIPTSFAPITPAARAAAAVVRRTGGVPDLHSMGAWENVLALKQVIEQGGIVGTGESLAADRSKLRDGLAKLHTMGGLLGPIERTADRESRKPFVIVQARQGRWRVVEGPIPSSP